MMTTNLHRLLALALLIIVGYGGYWLINHVWYGKYVYYQNHIEQLQDRQQRYAAIIAAQPELESALQQVKQDSSIERFYLNQTSPNLAATALQQQVKTIAESHGGRLASTQVLPVSEEGAFNRVAIRVQILVTEVEALQQTLHALESATPLLFIDNVQMRARQVRKRTATQRNQRAQRNQRDRRNRNRRRQALPVVTETQLTMQFELAGYMRKSTS